MKTNIKIIVAVAIGILVSIVSSYAIAETIMDSKSVYYKDNSGLLADNVQDAIDGTCVKFSEKVDTFLDKIYPVGSIYISTTMSNAAQVKAALGGEWQAYGNDKVLRGTGSKAEVTGGSDTVTLTTDNLPSHTHSFTPAGSVASTFKGTAVNSGTQSANHTHTFSGTTSTNGNHNHVAIFNLSGNGQYFQVEMARGTTNASPFAYTGYAGNHNHTYSGTTSANSANHYHSVTAAGTVTSTFSGTASNTGATGKGTAVNVQNSYITVFMYKRIS